VLVKDARGSAAITAAAPLATNDVITGTGEGWVWIYGPRGEATR
jgi:hypothetical protein